MGGYNVCGVRTMARVAMGGLFFKGKIFQEHDLVAYGFWAEFILIAKFAPVAYMRSTSLKVFASFDFAHSFPRCRRSSKV